VAARSSLEAASPLSLKDAGVVAGLLLVGVVAPVLLALSTHSLGIARNDDWAYRRVLLEFARTGHYSLVGWGSMTLVGQVLWAAPFVLLFGAQPWVPSLAVALLAAAGLVAAYLVARTLLGRPAAAVCVLLTITFPGFALSTADFMTDVPAWSAEMVCLLLGALALRSTGRAQLAWLASSMAAGLFGFSIREFDLAAPVAVLLALAWSDRHRLRTSLLYAVGFLAACGAVYLWSAGLPGTQPKALSLPTATSWEVLAGAYFTFSFMVCPALPGAVWRWRVWRSGPALVAVALALVVGALLVTGRHPIFIGNYLDQQGSGGDRVLAGTRPELFPGPVWEVLRAVALAAGIASAAVLGAMGAGLARAWRGWFRPQPQPGAERRLVVIFTWASIAVLAGYGLFFRTTFWDRYLWPVAFGALVIMLAGQSGGSPVLASGASLARPLVGGGPEGDAGGGLTGAPGPARPLPRLATRLVVLAFSLLVGTTAVLITLNSDSYDAARWAAGRDLVKGGYRATTVDAGFEWVGSHATGLTRPGRVVAGAPAYEQWYDQLFPGFRDCALVSASHLLWPSLRLIRTVSYDEVGFALPERLYLYIVDNSPCRVRANLADG
jgi:4-amino-4-deoxy-L-arabinose transferase-like glycosyltransferase